jgi:hypothetical protein
MDGVDLVGAPKGLWHPLQFTGLRPAGASELQKHSGDPQIKQQHGDICRGQRDWAGRDRKVEFYGV